MAAHGSYNVNPLKSIRLSLNLTQDQVSESTGLSKSAILRAEQGVYPNISDALLSFYAQSCLQADLTFVPSVLREGYRSFQRLTRLRSGPNPPVSASNGSRSDRLIGLMEPHRFRVTCHPFVEWRESMDLSQIAISKLYCVHPAMVYRFENQPHLCELVPEPLLEALREAGYSESTLDHLVTAYALHRSHLSREFKRSQLPVKPTSNKPPVGPLDLNASSRSDAAFPFVGLSDGVRRVC